MSEMITYGSWSEIMRGRTARTSSVEDSIACQLGRQFYKAVDHDALELNYRLAINARLPDGWGLDDGDDFYGPAPMPDDAGDRIRAVVAEAEAQLWELLRAARECEELEDAAAVGRATFAEHGLFSCTYSTEGRGLRVAPASDGDGGKVGDGAWQDFFDLDGDAPEEYMGADDQIKANAILLEAGWLITAGTTWKDCPGGASAIVRRWPE